MKSNSITATSHAAMPPLAKYLVSVLLCVVFWSTGSSALNDSQRPLVRRARAAAPQLFEIIVLTGGNPELLEKLFDSIAATDFLGDKISLKIKVGANEDKTLDLANRYEFPRAIAKKEVIEEANAEIGNLDSWVDAWPDPGNSNALILDGNMELSPLWYRFVKESWNEYGERSDLAGISLAKQAVTTSLWAPLRYMPVENEHVPFLFGMIVGSSAFSPHPKKWREFLSWVKSVDIDELRSRVPNIATILVELKNHDEIFFYHSRKAGGTTIAKWLVQLGEEKGKKVYLEENQICPSKYYRRFPEKAEWLYNDKVMSVTVLRDPVDRAVSSYHFEGRWETDKVKEMTPENEVPIDKYIDKTTSPENACNSGNFCIKCTSNCFCRWFGGDGKGNCDEANALDVLQSFDMVLYTADMKNPSFLRAVERIMDSKDVAIQTKNTTPGHQKKNSQINQEHYQRLESLNQMDRRIVRHVTGANRHTQVVQDWYKFLDEAKMWSLWTQLFNYWCKMNDLSILHVSPRDSRAMAASLSEFFPPDFKLVTDSSDYDQTFPSDLKKYRLDGSDSSMNDSSINEGLTA